MQWVAISRNQPLLLKTKIRKAFSTLFFQKKIPSFDLMTVTECKTNLKPLESAVISKTNSLTSVQPTTIVKKCILHFESGIWWIFKRQKAKRLHLTQKKAALRWCIPWGFFVDKYSFPSVCSFPKTRSKMSSSQTCTILVTYQETFAIKANYFC